MTKRIVLIGTLIVACLAVVFPPWGGFGGEFDHFAFALSPDEWLTRYPNVGATITWRLFGLEMAAILFAGAALYVIARR